MSKQGLHLTPEVLAAAYTFLRATPPFNRWKLPAAPTFRFRVTGKRDEEGLYDDKNGRATPEIHISKHFVGKPFSLLETMAHEMIHVHLFAKGVRKHHGPEFQRCAERVCGIHGFDPKRFS